MPLPLVGLQDAVAKTTGEDDVVDVRYASRWRRTMEVVGGAGRNTIVMDNEIDLEL